MRFLLALAVYAVVAGLLGSRFLAALQSRPLFGVGAWLQMLTPLVVLSLLSLPPLIASRGSFLRMAGLVAFTELFVVVGFALAVNGTLEVRLGTFTMLLVYGCIEYVVISIPVIVVVALLRR